MRCTRRVKIIALTSCLLIPVSPSAATQPVTAEQVIISLEKQSWVAWQSGDTAFWQRHLSSDHVEIDGPKGPQDRNYVLSGVAKRSCSVARYDLADFQFRPLGNDAALLVYRATQEFVCGDKHIPNTGWVTSAYRRHAGGWENVLFEHLLVPVSKPAP